MLRQNKAVERVRIRRLLDNQVPITLFPLDIRRLPDSDRYVVSNQPFASSPRSLNGTGYGTLNGKNLNENAALSNRKSIRFPSLIDASACARTKQPKPK